MRELLCKKKKAQNLGAGVWEDTQRHIDDNSINVSEFNSGMELVYSEGVENWVGCAGDRVEGCRGVKKRWNQKRETITQSLTGRKSTDLPSRQMYQIASRTFCLLLYCHVCAPATSSYGLYAVCCLSSSNTRTYIFSQHNVSCLHFTPLTRRSADIAFHVYFILGGE